MPHILTAMPRPHAHAACTQWHEDPDIRQSEVEALTRQCEDPGGTNSLSLLLLHTLWVKKAPFSFRFFVAFFLTETPMSALGNLRILLQSLPL